MVRVIIILFVLGLFTSCSKDDVTTLIPEVELTEKKLLLKEKILNGNLQTMYEYNADSTVAVHINYNSDTGQMSSRTEYSYTSNSIESTTIDATTEAVLSLRRYTRLSDNEGLREIYNSSGELSTSNTYSYDGNDCGYVSILASDALGNQLPATRVEYTDSNCSALFYSKYGDDPEYLRWDYIRNDKFDSSNSIIIPFFRVKKQRSVTKLSRYSSSGTLSSNLSFDAVFEYNESDHPTTEIRTYLDGDIEEFTFKYY